MREDINLKISAEAIHEIIPKGTAKEGDIGNIIYSKALFEKMLKKKDEPLNAQPVSSMSSVPQADSVIRTSPEFNRAGQAGTSGISINLKDKTAKYRESFKKYYIESKSHNMLIRAFGGAKAGFYGMMLSMLGMSSDEIEELKREAASTALARIKELINENEQASELSSITGGTKKQKKVQARVTNEMRKQLVTQAENLGLKGFFTQEKITEIKIEQCRNIAARLDEEKINLDYQIEMAGLGAEVNERVEDIKAKLFKISSLISKANTRIISLEKDLEKICAKKGSGSILRTASAAPQRASVY